jgi:LysM repeat protein
MPRRRSPARWLVPIVLLACVFAVYSIVNANLLSSDEPATSSTTSTTAKSGKARTVSQRSKSSKSRSRKRRSYTVKSGDTLSSIAVKTGVSLARIQQLNPKLDSNSLQTGQRVKLSP